MFAEESSVNANVDPASRHNLLFDASIIPRLDDPPPQVTTTPGASNCQQGAIPTPENGLDPVNRPPLSMD
ncbi:hypothetical protein D8674_037153 [Pyrus ussuriensis x Pyrus communis]|uniref:Uncharacterized protein n=1 Tax=Pyrus ussuriensis x Pyrus communis TaxID=2448454 RepID=A0A5N5FP14_9ROSA|nr:hypothetical protein D8674_037153 [Pyrus ussuriensis x Pyrus communis]